MRFISDQHTGFDASFQQGLRYPGAALVGTDKNLDNVLGGYLAHPLGYFAGIGSYLALDFCCADIAVIDCRIQCGVAASFFLGVVTSRGVRANRQHVYRSIGVLQIFTPYLANERNGRTKRNGQPARGREFLNDPQRYASLSGAAGQNDPASGLAHRQSATVRAFLFSENADAVGHGFVLHAGFGLQPCVARFAAVNIRLAVFALFGGGVGLPLLMQVVCDVDQFEGLALH